MKKMAQSTVELRNLLKTDFELFDFDYDFDDKSFKQEIEQAVIDYYYFYEIGQETPDRFKHTFKRRFLSMIDYYNKLHNTTLLEYNPLVNYKMTELLDELSNTSNQQNTQTNADITGKTTTTGNDTVSGTDTSDNTRTDNLTQQTDLDEKTSDYPQQNIGSGDYLDGARIQNTSTTNTGTVENTTNFDTNRTTTRDNITNVNDTSNTQEDTTASGSINREYEKTIEGITGITYQELIQKERDNLIRIKSMIIEELKPCFILIH